MATAISMSNSANVFLQDVTIRGFKKGIEARNSHVFLDRVNIQRCGIGLDLIRSRAIINQSQLYDNAVDLIVNRSKAYLIHTVVNNILLSVNDGDYRINPFHIRNTIFGIINTADVHEKRRRLKQLLSYLKYTPLAWTVYQILKEILHFAR